MSLSLVPKLWIYIHTYVCIRVTIHIGHINDSFIQLFILAFIHLHGKLVSLFGVSFTLAQTPFWRQFSYFLLGLRVNNHSNWFFFSFHFLLMSSPCLCISIILFVLLHLFRSGCGLWLWVPRHATMSALI